MENDPLQPTLPVTSPPAEVRSGEDIALRLAERASLAIDVGEAVRR